MKVIRGHDLDQLSRQAAQGERLRKNHNLHDSYDDPCQRLFNAIEPGTYIRPHRHTTPPKSETFVVVRGALALVLFDDSGAIREVIGLSDRGDALAVDLPPGEWHAVVSLAPGTIFFETKPGPYQPLDDKDFAPWAPAEGAPQAQSYLAQLESHIVGLLAEH